MKAGSAHVPDERIVLTEQERAEREAAVEEGAAEFERGEIEEARAFALRLVARS